MPAATPQDPNSPVNVSPAAADKVLNQPKPGLGIIDILANTIAPLVVESESMSVSNVVQELVEAAGNQDKVSELTTKLNDSVSHLRETAGLPQEPKAEMPDAGAPAEAAPAPSAATPPPQNLQPTAPGPQAQGNTPMTAQASRREAELAQEVTMLKAERSLLLRGQRIAAVVTQAQSVGLLDNYNKFIRDGKSRREAKRLAQLTANAKVRELVTMDEKACAQVLDTMVSATKQLAALSGTGAAAKRAAVFARMRSESGNVRIASAIPGASMEAKDIAPGSRRLALSWKVANDINSEKYDEQLQTVHRPKD
jgi:hypothetical protein